MSVKKSKIKLRQFKNSGPKQVEIITRITSLQNAIEFIDNNTLHFSPLSCYKDYTEGKSFEQALIQESESKSDKKLIPNIVRREILYVSCWSEGEESLHMWDIYGKNNYAVAIQIHLNDFINKVTNKGCFWFESKSFGDLIRDYKSHFKPSSFHYGLINYCDLLIQENNVKQFIGQFKELAFAHENEFRFLIRQNYFNHPPVGLRDLKCKFTNNSFKNIAIKLIVNPYAKKDYFEFIKTRFKNQKQVEIIPSKFTKLFI